MTWLFEEPWTIIIWATVIEIALGIAVYTTGRAVILLAMLGVGAVAGGLLVVEKLVVTEREKVLAVLYEAADAVERSDLEGVLARVSPSSRELRSRIRSELSRYRIDSVSIKNDLKIALNSLTSPPTATAEFLVVVSGGPRRGGPSEISMPLRFAVNFQYEGFAWLITGYDDRAVFGLAK